MGALGWAFSCPLGGHGAARRFSTRAHRRLVGKREGDNDDDSGKSVWQTGHGSRGRGGGSERAGRQRGVEGEGGGVAQPARLADSPYPLPLLTLCLLPLPLLRPAGRPRSCGAGGGCVLSALRLAGAVAAAMALTAAATVAGLCIGFRTVAVVRRARRRVYGFRRAVVAPVSVSLVGGREWGAGWRCWLCGLVGRA